MSNLHLYLSRPHMSGHEQKYVADAFASGFITPLGPQLDEFEKRVADYLGNGSYCVGLSSGSAALHLALRIAGVGVGDEVWISSMTFAGGIFPVNYLGARPRFFDLSPESWTIDVGLLEEYLLRVAATGKMPKAIVPTDLYGQSVDLDPLEKLAAKFGVNLIIDSAESLGARYRGGRKAGTGGDAAILSFNGNKIITTSGGGMLVTPHRSWAEQARFLATQARDPAPHYEHSTFGYNYRMSNVCAAIGLGQMEVLENRVQRRREIYRRYSQAFAMCGGVSLMPEPREYHSTRWLTAITVDPKQCGTDREKIRTHLLSHGIESRPLWKPMHLQPLYAGAPYHGRGFDEHIFKHGLCLPSGSDMSDKQQDDVIGRVLALFRA